MALIEKGEQAVAQLLRQGVHHGVRLVLSGQHRTLDLMKAGEQLVDHARRTGMEHIEQGRLAIQEIRRHSTGGPTPEQLSPAHLDRLQQQLGRHGVRLDVQRNEAGGVELHMSAGDLGSLREGVGSARRQLDSRNRPPAVGPEGLVPAAALREDHAQQRERSAVRAAEDARSAPERAGLEQREPERAEGPRAR